ncbi:uncharacterized protein LOC104426664 [Eucalyptus grandis]|uniref:DUF6737 domain-containing protein n=2 Tax=Eucalyptus grandis TaxID=71139 RepID=A0A059A721_EUCGR|nr:uncharacterized protein LOC104426664 [Eucalyptus grandis]KAK3407291.1 hypothetical protein EUGRSUZ_K03368 [Eucalyptus grandis]
MGTMSPFPLCISCVWSPSLPSSRTHLLSRPVLSARASSSRGKAAAGNSRRGSAAFATGSNERSESAFVDENGVVDDMDGYLNYLSPEYESVWDTKPSWCQPWTITLTGMLAIAGSWLILHSMLVTTIISLLICSWWYIFLYSYPKAYTDMIAERRKRVRSGVEDIFGSTKADGIDQTSN